MRRKPSDMHTLLASLLILSVILTLVTAFVALPLSIFLGGLYYISFLNANRIDEANENWVEPPNPHTTVEGLRQDQTEIIGEVVYREPEGVPPVSTGRWIEIGVVTIFLALNVIRFFINDSYGVMIVTIVLIPIAISILTRKSSDERYWRDEDMVPVPVHTVEATPEYVRHMEEAEEQERQRALREAYPEQYMSASDIADSLAKTNAEQEVKELADKKPVLSTDEIIEELSKLK